ncbi:MAG: hypothetical protein E7397_00105 [Ruminococcaceae bacterium]|nr:hypothetical protein [Oscillospiraceae bacterium]
MKKIITVMLTASMLLSSMTTFAAVKDAPALTEGFEISLDAYNLRNDGTTSANVIITKDGVPYEGEVTVSVDGNAVSGKNVSSTTEGIHMVTAEVEGETLTTYFSYTHKYGACAVKDTVPVFFEDFQDDTYESEGAAALLQGVGGFTGSANTQSFKATDGAQGNRPNNTALQFHTKAGESFQTEAFGPELADYQVEYFFRGQSYSGSAQTAIGINLGLRYNPTDTLPYNAYRIIYAPFGKRNGNSSIATSGASRIYDVLAIGRTGKNGLKNGVPGYMLSGIQTSTSNAGQSYTSDASGRTITLNSNQSFTENKFYKMTAYAFSNTVAANTYDPTTGKTLRKVSVDTSNDYNIQVGDGANKTTISKGKTILAAQEYIFRVDDLAIYKLYNCKNMYEEVADTAKVGEPLAILSNMNGVDNNAVPQAVVNYKVSAKNMNIYTEGLDFTVDKENSTVTFTDGGTKIIPMEYVGANGLKKGVVAVVSVEDELKYDVEEPVIKIENGVAKAEVKIANTTYIDRSAVLYLASYSVETNTLTGISVSDTVNFAPGTGDTLKAEFTLPAEYGEGCMLKAFVWEDMEPLSQSSL